MSSTKPVHISWPGPANPHNRWWRVVRPFTVYAVRGTKPSNVYVGSSMALDWVYEEIRLKRGDQVHELVGGNFVVRADSSVFEFHTRKTAAHEIFLHPPPPMPNLPTENLRPLVRPEQIRRVENYRRHEIF